jgi:hypothetical protein
MAGGVDLVGNLLHRGHGVTSEMKRRAFGCEGSRHGASNRAAGSVDDGCLSPQLLAQCSDLL